ncbi:hypothetical protein GQ600_17813 [Phytophthora cactorum]|nr:hypothetical protein GQ600_17813 [Phytophthora cactorum]
MIVEWLKVPRTAPDVAVASRVRLLRTTRVVPHGFLQLSSLSERERRPCSRTTAQNETVTTPTVVLTAKSSSAGDDNQRFVVTKQKKSKYSAKLQLDGQKPLYLGRYRMKSRSCCSVRAAYSVIPRRATRSAVHRVFEGEPQLHFESSTILVTMRLHLVMIQAYPGHNTMTTGSNSIKTSRAVHLAIPQVRTIQLDLDSSTRQLEYPAMKFRRRCCVVAHTGRHGLCVPSSEATTAPHRHCRSSRRPTTSTYV